MWLKVALMATSLIQTRFDVGTESAELWRVVKLSASLVILLFFRSTGLSRSFSVQPLVRSWVSPISPIQMSKSRTLSSNVQPSVTLHYTKNTPPGWLSGERVGLSGCESDPRSMRTSFPAYFRLSPPQKHVRKVVGGFGRKGCVSTGVRKPGNTCASPTAMIWP